MDSGFYQSCGSPVVEKYFSLIAFLTFLVPLQKEEKNRQDIYNEIPGLVPFFIFFMIILVICTPSLAGMNV